MTVKEGPSLGSDKKILARFKNDSWVDETRLAQALSGVLGVGADVHLGGAPTADTPPADAAGEEIVTAAWLRDFRLGIENLAPGQEFLIKCWDGVQLPRAQYTSRTDVRLVYARIAYPLMGGEYGIAGVDLWQREHWASP